MSSRVLPCGVTQAQPERGEGQEGAERSIAFWRTARNNVIYRPQNWRESMRILSLNAWGGRLSDRLIAYLVEADPDVLCLQEVTHTRGVRSEWLLYRDHGVELPQRANLFAE